MNKENKEVYAVIILKDLNINKVAVCEDFDDAKSLFHTSTGIYYDEYVKNQGIIDEHFVGSVVLPTNFISKDLIKEKTLLIKDMVDEFWVNIVKGDILKDSIPFLYNELQGLSILHMSNTDISNWFVRLECYEEYLLVFASDKLDTLDNEDNLISYEWTWSVIDKDDILKIKDVLSVDGVDKLEDILNL